MHKALDARVPHVTRRRIAAVIGLRLIHQRIDVLTTHAKPPPDAQRRKLAPLDPVADRLQRHAKDRRDLSYRQQLLISHTKPA